MRFLLLLAATALAAHCTPQAPLSGQLRQVSSFPSGQVVWLVQPQGFSDIAANFTGKIIDSAIVAPDGRFAFAHMPDAAEPTLFQLVVQPRGVRYPNRLHDEDPLMANYMPFVWKNGEKLSFTADALTFQASAALQPLNADNAALVRLRDLRQDAFKQYKTLVPVDAHDETALPQAEAAIAQFRHPLMQFADSCNRLWPALVAIRWVSPTGDFERIPEFLARQCNRWKQQHPHDPRVKTLCELGDTTKLPLLTGYTVPDFPLPLRTGDTVGLHRLLGQRLTLLDLWASWCAPCRRENRDVLVPLWDAFHARGFQIVGYALDSDHNTWQKAVEKDGAGRWPQATHLQGDDAPLLRALRLTTIPANLLIDAQGKIVAKNLHGDALRALVEAYLK